jgi:hypothetical protein
MTAVLLASKDRLARTDVAEFEKRLQQHGVPLSKIDADSADGANKREAYDRLNDVVVMVTRDDGSTVYEWLDELPPPGDVSYHYHGA